MTTTDRSRGERGSRAEHDERRPGRSAPARLDGELEPWGRARGAARLDRVESRAREPEPVDDRGAPEGAAPRLLRSPSRCPYCHDACAEADAVTVCRGCLARHHLECWDAGEACAACGGVRALREVTTAAQVRRAEAEAYAAAVRREPLAVRLTLGAAFALLTVVCVCFGVFVVARAVAAFEGPIEWLFGLPFALVLFSVFPAWVCWRAARLRLFPTPVAASGERASPCCPRED